MKRISALSCLLLATLSPAQAVERPWESYFGTLQSDFKTIYALEDFKLGRFGWDREMEFDQLRTNLHDLRPDAHGDVRQALKIFFRRTRDYHTGIYFKNTWDSAELPFGIRTVDGRAFVTSVDEALPVRVGDELIRFGGVPITEMLNRFILRPLNAVPTDRSFADRYLTRRPGYENFRLPTSPVALEFRRKNGETVRFQLNWKVIPSRSSPSFMSNSTLEILPARIDRSREAIRSGGRVDLVNAIGNRAPFVPEIGKTIWQSDKSSIFFARIGRTSAGSRVGFIRISSYLPEHSAAAIAEFDALVGRMQSETDVLILDQTNNGGGSVLYFYELLSRLIPNTVSTTLKFRWSLQPMNFHLGKKWEDLEASLRNVQSDAEARQILGDRIWGYPVDLKTARGVYSEAKQVLHEVATSSNRVSSPMPLLHIDEVEPKGNMYTKPLIMLTNEFSFSAADMAPAMLRDLRRATIFGARTPGLGAYVTERDPPAVNPYGIWFHALSMAVVTRAGDRAIENTGVTPDVGYTITADDLQNGFRGYQAALTELSDQKAALRRR